MLQISLFLITLKSSFCSQFVRPGYPTKFCPYLLPLKYTVCKITLGLLRSPDLSPKDPFLPLKLLLLWRDTDVFLQMRSKYLGSFDLFHQVDVQEKTAWLGKTAPFSLPENQKNMTTSSLDSCLEYCSTFPPTTSISY